MSKKATNIVAYLGPIGFIIAFLAGDRVNSRFHLNQSLVLCICEILLSVAAKIAGYIPLIGVFIRIAIGFLSFVMFILWIIGIASAISGTEKEIPLLGWIHLL
ncbi:MAG: hypothetical protein PUC06_08740 [Oscillospiraceae bacterium]|nr:hypothetical protein [Oscillospiraceae bacterium]